MYPKTGAYRLKSEDVINNYHTMYIKLNLNYYNDLDLILIKHHW